MVKTTFMYADIIYSNEMKMLNILLQHTNGCYECTLDPGLVQAQEAWQQYPE